MEGRAWSLSTLSTRASGLGLRRTTTHSPAAYVSSATECCSLCKQLDPQHEVDFNAPDTAQAHALTDYNA
eukprot:3864750-Karenia_brevis.AAC.1